MVLGCILCQQPLVTRIQHSNSPKKKIIYSKLASKSKSKRSQAQAALQQLQQQMQEEEAAHNKMGLMIPPEQHEHFDNEPNYSRKIFHPFQPYQNSSSSPSKSTFVDESVNYATKRNTLPSSIHHHHRQPHQPSCKHDSHSHNKSKSKPSGANNVKNSAIGPNHACPNAAAANPNHNSNNDEYDVLASRCGHLFHRICLKNYIAARPNVMMGNKRECPFCQKPITLAQCIKTELIVPEEDLILDDLNILLEVNDSLQKQAAYLRDVVTKEREAEVEKLRIEVEALEKQNEIKRRQLKKCKLPFTRDDFMALKNNLAKIKAENEALAQRNVEFLAMIERASKIANQVVVTPTSPTPTPITFDANNNNYIVEEKLLDELNEVQDEEETKATTGIELGKMRQSRRSAGKKLSTVLEEEPKDSSSSSNSNNALEEQECPSILLKPQMVTQKQKNIYKIPIKLGQSPVKFQDADKAPADKLKSYKIKIGATTTLELKQNIDDFGTKTCKKTTDKQEEDEAEEEVSFPLPPSNKYKYNGRQCRQHGGARVESHNYYGDDDDDDGNAGGGGTKTNAAKFKLDANLDNDNPTSEPVSTSSSETGLASCVEFNKLY